MPAVLELKDITKQYPGVTALAGVQFTLNQGEVHALVGENGAGKSTLIKIITGAIEPTAGEIWVEGKRIEKMNPHTAIELGIAAVYQEFNLVPKMTVAENIFLGRFPQTNGLVDTARMNDEAEKILRDLGVDVNPESPVSSLTVGYQQLVEIAKSVSKKVKILIMDEPSAPLTNNEMKYLYGIVRALKASGVSIIYISHRLEEVFDLCDSVTVFRDGQYITSMKTAETSRENLITLMVNRTLGNSYPEKPYEKGETTLTVKNISTAVIKNVSFEACKGEILGFAGLVGSGRTETVRAIFGADAILAGEIWLEGKKILPKSPADAIKEGIGLIPEDRKQHGLLLHMSVGTNITYAFLHGLFKHGLISRTKENEIAADYIQKLTIKTPSSEQLVKNLSGGNQQKAVLAKWLLTACRILIFDEPTRGIDVGAKQEIYQLMVKLVQTGITVIMISSEMPELIGMADRIIVMHEGKIAGELSGNDISQKKIMTLASGIKNKEVQ